MIIYLDTSVLLRRLLKQKEPLSNWGKWEKALVSQITRVEALRTLDRFRLQKMVNDQQLSACIEDLFTILKGSEVITLDSSILNRAAQPFPTSIGTLDALHLSSALLWQEENEEEITFLTHDIQLGRTAISVGLRAEGFRN